MYMVYKELIKRGREVWLQRNILCWKGSSESVKVKIILPIMIAASQILKLLAGVIFFLSYLEVQKVWLSPETTGEMSNCSLV